MSESKIKVEETNLEDLIILGEEKHIPITIEFPNPNGGKIKAKASIKQITVKEMDKIKLNENNPLQMNIQVLETSLLKQDGSNFTKEQILNLPLGVMRELTEKILEVSGVGLDDEIRNF